MSGKNKKNNDDIAAENEKKRIKQLYDELFEAPYSFTRMDGDETKYRGLEERYARDQKYLQEKCIPTSVSDEQIQKLCRLIEMQTKIGLNSMLVKSVKEEGKKKTKKVKKVESSEESSEESESSDEEEEVYVSKKTKKPRTKVATAKKGRKTKELDAKEILKNAFEQSRKGEFYDKM